MLPAAGLVGGCAGPRAEAARPVAPAPVAATITTPATPEIPALPAVGDPLVFVEKSSAAPWVEPPLDGDDPFLHIGETVLGVDAALVHTSLGVFLHHRVRGISGPLKLPEPPRADDAADSEPDVGLGKGDEVLYAGPSGQVFGAADAQAPLIARGKVAGAKLWDFAPGLVVATRADTVFASTDGGKTFRSSTPKRGSDVTAVVARFDGVIVVETEDDTFISRDHGRRWAASLLGGTVQRRGAWLDICGHVLAKDGRHWLEVEPSGFDDAWATPLFLDEHPRALGLSKQVTALIPPPPIAPPNASDDELHIGCSGPHGPRMVGRLGARGIGKIIPWKPFGLARIAGTMGPAPEGTRSHFAFLGDGACDPSEAGEEGDPYACRESAKILRPAHLASVDRKTLATTVLDVPSRCAAVHVREAMGLGVIGCRVGPSEIGLELASSSSVGAHETDLRVTGTELPELMQAADGSLLVPAAPGTMKALVRSPVALGASAAWRIVAIDGAIAYRVVAGGVVLAVVAPSADATSFDLVRDDGKAPPRVIARAAPVYGGVDDVSVDPSGRIVVSVRDAGGKQHDLWVGQGGGLVLARN